MNIDTRPKKNLSYEDAKHALEQKFDDNPTKLTGRQGVDMVEKPPHYNHGKFETIEVIEDWKLNYHCGNAVKYISRHMHKGRPVEDIKKAVWYLQRYLLTLEEEQNA
jgi:hypothetical protein